MEGFREVALFDLYTYISKSLWLVFGEWIIRGEKWLQTDLLRGSCYYNVWYLFHLGGKVKGIRI